MSEPRKYRKKPLEIEAMLYDGTTVSQNQIIFWMESSLGLTGDKVYEVGYVSGFRIVTLEGPMRVNPGDYVIKGIKGEFYPCRNDIFNETYEEAS